LSFAKQGLRFMDYGTTYIILACAFGLFMAWGVGANDVANAMGTSIGSGAVTIKQAIIIAAIFEFSGAFLAGGQVTATIRKGIIDAQLVTGSPEILVWGMLASLLAAAIWLLIATRLGWPVSTTHSIVGAIVGFGIIAIGFEAIHWSKVGSIAMSWVVSPVMAGAIGFALFISVQKLILNADNPLQNAKRYVPYYMFLVGFIVSLVTLFKGLKHVGINLPTGQSYGIAAIFGVLIMITGIVYIRQLKFDPAANRDFHFANVEKVFGILMIATACAMAFAHGSNDVANAIGPLAAVVSIVEHGGQVAQKSALPIWILFLGGIGIIVGLLTYGHKVIATIGTGITQLTPSRGFSATLAAATTVVLASGTGLPISTTHTLVGAVLGVGLARGIAALNLNVIKTIFLSWIITLPAGALLSILFYLILKAVFSAA